MVHSRDKEIYTINRQDLLLCMQPVKNNKPSHSSLDHKDHDPMHECGCSKGTINKEGDVANAQKVYMCVQIFL